MRIFAKKPPRPYVPPKWTVSVRPMPAVREVSIGLCYSPDNAPGADVIELGAGLELMYAVDHDRVIFQASKQDRAVPMAELRKALDLLEGR